MTFNHSRRAGCLLSATAAMLFTASDVATLARGQRDASVRGDSDSRIEGTMAPGVATGPAQAPLVDDIRPYPTVAPSIMVAADYDGDGRTDAAIFAGWAAGRVRNWVIRSSNGAGTALFYGNRSYGDVPVPADYDGDGRADIAIYRYSTGEWILAQSSSGFRTVAWGTPEFGDVPVATDYDGDGLTDFAVYRTATGQWYVSLSGGGALGATLGDPADDVPVLGDFDGDGKGDLTVYGATTGHWRSLLSGGGTADHAFGSAAAADIPAAADYDGDGRADRAVYRSTTGQWIVRPSGGGESVVQWGDPSEGDMPVPADYDGDGRADIAVYRYSNGTWFILRSSDYQMTAFGWGSPEYSDRARIELRPPFPLRGRIVSAASGSPVPGARVAITSAPYADVAASANPSGEYAIAPTFTRGQLTVVVTAPGYFSQVHTIDIYGPRQADFALTAQPFPPAVVINEFRTRGPNGADDEFIELRNVGLTSVSLSGWLIWLSNGSGATAGPAQLPAVELRPGCQFLLGNTNPNGYAGPVDAGVFWGITDDGGIALSRPDGVVADMVGMSAGSTYKEGGTLTPLTTDGDRSYARAGADSNNNATDFAPISPSTPSGWAASCGTP